MSIILESKPIVSIFAATASITPPVLADPTVLGSIPHRAAVYCQPLIAATGYGWYIYPPADFDLLWDGDINYWRPAGTDRWSKLHIVQFSEFDKDFVESAPAWASDLTAIPAIAHSPERGLIQLWTGLLIKTSENWSTHIGPLVNYPRLSHFEVFEGIIETEWWFGPLVTPLRITKTDQIIEFRKNRPYCQMKPVLNECFARETLENSSFHVASSYFGDEQWIELKHTLEMRGTNKSERGGYKKEALRRKKKKLR